MGWEQALFIAANTAAVVSLALHPNKEVPVDRGRLLAMTIGNGWLLIFGGFFS